MLRIVTWVCAVLRPLKEARPGEIVESCYHISSRSSSNQPRYKTKGILEHCLSQDHHASIGKVGFIFNGVAATDDVTCASYHTGKRNRHTRIPCVRESANVLLKVG